MECVICFETCMDYTLPCCGAETHQACLARVRQDACPFCREPLDPATLGEEIVEKARKRQRDDAEQENEETLRDMIRMERELGLAPGTHTAALALLLISEMTSIPRLLSYQTCEDFREAHHRILHQFGNRVRLPLSCRAINRFLEDVWQLFVQFPRPPIPVDQQKVTWILENIHVPGPVLFETAKEKYGDHLQIGEFAGCYAESIRVTMATTLLKAAFSEHVAF